MGCKDESLFHYSDIGAIASIIKNRKLWLTNIGFLNDYEEMFEGVRCIKAQYEKYDFSDFSNTGENFSKGFLIGVLGSLSADIDSFVFTCSFSRASNLLSQWRGYGNFAVEFSRDVIEADYLLVECIYTQIKKNREAKRLIGAVVGDFRGWNSEDHDKYQYEAAITKLKTGAVAFKNKHFEAEHEVRLIVSGVDDKSSIFHRARGDYLVPFIELPISAESITAIHIGPIANQSLAERSLKSLLKSCDMSGVPIVKSKIPYRA